MKAYKIYKYKSSPPLDLKLEEVEKPRTKGDQVLIKVGATAINDYDIDSLRKR